MLEVMRQSPYPDKPAMAIRKPFHLSSLLMVLVLLAGIEPCCSDRTAAVKECCDIIKSSVGCKFAALGDVRRAQVVSCLRLLYGDFWQSPEEGTPFSLMRWEGDGTDYVLIVVYSGIYVPDVSWMAIHCLSAEWKQLAVRSFPTGYRKSIVDVDVSYCPEISRYAAYVTLTGNPDVSGVQVREIYAMKDRRPILVRYEQQGSVPVRARYDSREPWEGPALPKRTLAKWQEMLNGKDDVDVLEALVWLTGVHRPSADQRSEFVNMESIEDAMVYESARASAAVMDVVRRLALERAGWVRDYALLALGR